MKVCLCLGAQGAADTNDKSEEPQAGCAWLVGWHGILAWREGLLEEAVRRAPRARARGGWPMRWLMRWLMCWLMRDVLYVSPAGSQVLISKIV